MTDELQVSNFLDSLRLHLRPMPIDDREEIVREIGAHIRDSAEANGTPLTTILDRLGPATELAAQYRDGLLLSKAGRSLSPLLLLRASLRLATKGVFGFVVFMLGLTGYVSGAALVLAAFIKPLAPEHAGVFVQDGKLISLGVLIWAPPNSHEVLGIWLIPIGLTAGSLILLLTSFLIRNALRASRGLQSRL